MQHRHTLDSRALQVIQEALLKIPGVVVHHLVRALAEQLHLWGAAHRCVVVCEHTHVCVGCLLSEEHAQDVTVTLSECN